MKFGSKLECLSLASLKQSSLMFVGKGQEPTLEKGAPGL